MIRRSRRPGRWRVVAELFRTIPGAVRSFDDVGADFARETGLLRAGRVGDVTALLGPQRPLIDYATGWFTDHRSVGGTEHTVLNP